MREIAIFSGNAHPELATELMDHLRDLKVVEIVCTNTVPIPPEKPVPKLQVLSVAPASAQAVRPIHNGESVSALFS